MRARRVVGLLVVGAAVSLAALVYDWWEDLGDADGRFPARITIDDVVAQLPLPVPAGAVVVERADDRVRVEPLQPGDFRGARRALVAPARAQVRWRTAVPSDGVMRFAVGVAAGRDGTSGPTRFTVAIDGNVAYARVIDPGDRRQRRWFDEEVSLSDVAGHEVTIDLVTEPAGHATAVGRPGWSRVMVIRRTGRERQPAAPGAPNVLLLLVDTLRADVLGCYGASPSPSEILDGLAARGTVFEQAVAQAPWTLPSVASLLTGLLPRMHGVVGRSLTIAAPAGIPVDAERGFLPDRVPTIASEAARSGVTTFGVSSNPLVSLENNLARGFERFVVLRSDWEGTQWARAPAVHESFLRWAGRNRDRRFFAYLHYMEPHDPYVPDPAMAPPDDPSLPDEVRAGDIRRLAEAIERGGPPLAPRPLAHLRARYLGAVHAWDRAFGELLQGLEALGLLDRTVIVVTADHGEEFQEHGQLGHRRQLYDESLRVPLVVVGPGVPASRRTDQVQGIDLFPTVAALLGVRVPPGLPGHDVNQAPPADRAAVSETAYGIARGETNVELLALRTPAAKLVWAPALAHHEYYDLGLDPGERVDRWPEGDGRDAAGELARQRDRAVPPPVQADADPALADKLRALGYLR